MKCSGGPSLGRPAAEPGSLGCNAVNPIEGRFVLCSTLAFVFWATACTTPDRSSTVDPAHVRISLINDGRFHLWIHGEEYVTDKSSALIFRALEARAAGEPAPDLQIKAVTQTGDSESPYLVNLNGEVLRARRIRPMSVAP